MSLVRRAGLLLCILSLTACELTFPAGTPDTEDPGDAVDPGSLAQCTFVPGATCGTEGAVRLDGCDVESLQTFPHTGAWAIRERAEKADGSFYFLGASGMRLLKDASLGEVINGKPVVEHVGEEGVPRVFIVSEGPVTVQGQPQTWRTAYTGCSMVGRQELRGCWELCRDGVRSRGGTFRAVRHEDAALAAPQGLELVGSAPASYLPTDMPADVYVAHGHAYVVTLHGGLFVYDVSNPAAPVLRKHEYLADDNSWNAVWSAGDALYVGSAKTGVRVYDLTDPANPVFLRALPDGAGSVNTHTLFVDGTTLYATYFATEKGVLLFDITDPRNPVLRARYTSPLVAAGGSAGLHDMFAFENRLYVNSWESGLEVADVSVPSAPSFLGAYRYPAASSHASAVRRYGDRVVAFEGGEDWGAHLRVLDVTDPANIRLLGEWRGAEHTSIHNFVLRGELLYVAHYQQGVRVLDVSVPWVPMEVASYRTWREADRNAGAYLFGGAIGMRVPGDGYIYTVDMNRGLLILRHTPL